MWSSQVTSAFTTRQRDKEAKSTPLSAMQHKTFSVSQRICLLPPHRKQVNLCTAQLQPRQAPSTMAAASPEKIAQQIQPEAEKQVGSASQMCLAPCICRRTPSMHLCVHAASLQPASYIRSMHSMCIGCMTRHRRLGSAQPFIMGVHLSTMHTGAACLYSHVGACRTSNLEWRQTWWVACCSCTLHPTAIKSCWLLPCISSGTTTSQ